jgi:hypothetical protein
MPANDQQQPTKMEIVETSENSPATPSKFDLIQTNFKFQLLYSSPDYMFLLLHFKSVSLLLNNLFSDGILMMSVL